LALRFDVLTLQLFVAIVEEQSIAKAAEREHIAASAVSRRISDLEAMLKVALLIRHPKGIDPTPAGAALLRHARLVLGNLERLEAELTDYERGLRGLVRIAANKSAILQSLPEELARFLEQHPMVRIDLEEELSPAIIMAVVENSADIGIFGGNIPAPALETFLYREDELVAVTPLRHKLAERKAVRFVEMVEHDFVCLEKGSSIETLCVREADALKRELKLRVRVSSFEALFRLVEAGLGIGLVPASVAERNASTRSVAAVPLAEPWARRPLNLGVRDLASLPVAARLLVEHLTAGEACLQPSPAAMPASPTETSPLGAEPT
jgi:DNA-binding transcriptional LysR family regulator